MKQKAELTIASKAASLEMKVLEAKKTTEAKREPRTAQTRLRPVRKHHRTKLPASKPELSKR